MISIEVHDETSPLEVVVLGLPDDFGGTPTIEEAYDPKSIHHIKNGTFPTQEDITREMNEFKDVLESHGIEVLRPMNIPGLNQVFARDIGIAIGDRFIVPKILYRRKEEIKGIRHIVEKMEQSKVLEVHGDRRIEGGDVMPLNGKIFAGYSREADFDQHIVSRTNEAGIDFLIENFKDWEVHAFELNKSDTDPHENALHLDCCFQPIGKDQALIYRGGFKNQSDFDYLIDFYGEDKVIQLTNEEMYQMGSNIFSISPEVIISTERFKRINAELRSRGFTVEEVEYREIGKMEGLLRCSTMPIRRRYV